ncbi:hypothetical protein ALC56_03862 [Trachymyrmex septentrionalis]|uniref:Uncharacterized protein n=1 Tax=Trachymyrmex septentrionalis TaxID=34720 RepID=A0A195FP49_9HYME|nr:hypothetical protein ALC56_03862 [Trachymyrmex septentrionalis]
MPKVPGSILIGTKIFTLLSEKADREYPCPQKHLSKNPPFRIGNKTESPICSWQLSNQQNKMIFSDKKLTTSINHSVTNDRAAFVLLQVDDRVRSPGTSRSCLTVTTMSLSISPSSPEEPVTL